MKAEETERREYFRIQDRLLLEFKAITDKEAAALERSFEEWDGGPPEPEIVPIAQHPSGAGRDETRDYFETIDRKLDAIIHLLTSKTNLFESRYLNVCLSGSGIQFISSTEFKENSFVELHIILPRFPNYRVAVLGKVIRSSKCAQCELDDSWDTGLAFTAIREKDRDLLINYIFSKERESLRAKQDAGGMK
jgi:hypothetical protein